MVTDACVRQSSVYRSASSCFCLANTFGLSAISLALTCSDIFYRILSRWGAEGVHHEKSTLVESFSLRISNRRVRFVLRGLFSAHAGCIVALFGEPGITQRTGPHKAIALDTTRSVRVDSVASSKSWHASLRADPQWVLNLTIDASRRCTSEL